MMHITVYTRPNCALCEEAKQLLQLVQQEVPFTFEEVDIEQDDALHEQWLLRIPVIVHEHHIIQEGVVDYVTIEQAIVERMQK